jgi:hypothetical protein
MYKISGFQSIRYLPNYPNEWGSVGLELLQLYTVVLEKRKSLVTAEYRI